MPASVSPSHAGCSAGGRALARFPRVGAAQGRQRWQDLLLEQTHFKRLSGRPQLVSRSSGTELGMRRGSSTSGTGIRVSVRMTFFLGDGRHRQLRGRYTTLGAVPSLLYRGFPHREQWSLFLPSTWHTARVGSDPLWYSSHRLYGCTRTSFRAVWTTINSPTSLLW